MNKRKILIHYLQVSDIIAAITDKSLCEGPLLHVFSKLNFLNFSDVNYFFNLNPREVVYIYVTIVKELINKCEEPSLSKFTVRALEFSKDPYSFLGKFYSSNINCSSSLYPINYKFGEPSTYYESFHFLNFRSNEYEVYLIHGIIGEMASDYFIYESTDNLNLKLIVDRNDYKYESTLNLDHLGILGSLSSNVLKFFREITFIKETADTPKNFKDFITNDPIVLEKIEFANFLSKINDNVLLIGETGTGKEIFARSIHESSNRKDGPFIAVNCAAIPKGLFESEMFGIEQGRATGVSKHIGAFEAANNGTLFLDEIGELPMEFQSKILRVIQQKEVKIVGSNKPKKIDFRLICGTNKELSEKLDIEFRSDLYFRINIIRINLPPLRKRIKSDVQRLLEHFLTIEKNYHPEYKSIRFESRVLLFLLNYHWPGNVRQLEGFVKMAFLMAAYMSKNIDEDIMENCLDANIIGKTNIVLSELPIETTKKKLTNPNNEKYENIFNVEFFDGFNLNELIIKIEKEYLKKGLTLVKNQSELGRLLGLSQPTISRLLYDYKLK